jgi:hypothetical protein
MYQSDRAAASEDLNRADTVLMEKSEVVAESDLDEERARILRVRVEKAVAANDLTAAKRILGELEKMGASGSISIQRSYSGAAGTLLLAQKKYRDAIGNLEQDFMNPVSIRLLITAYQKAGDTDHADEQRKRLLDWKIPMVEEALTVFPYRAQQGVIVVKK